MIGLIFLGLLGCVHGLGDAFPYTNSQEHAWTTAAQATGKWVADKCGSGTKQSPIDIVSTKAVVMKGDPGPIMAFGFDADIPMDWRVNGLNTKAPSSIELSYPLLASGIHNTPAVKGGPLTQSYAFSHIEFHWGKDAATLGGEHTIDGLRAKMEMHVVLHKTSFGTLAQEIARQAWSKKIPFDRAVKASVTAPIDPAGIAVIAYQIDEGAENAELLPLTLAIAGLTTNAKAGMALKTTHTPGTGTSYVPLAVANMNISKLLMQDEGALEDYYYYDGSLTAPSDLVGNTAHSCAEIVRWILPTKRLTMSTAQMAVFNGNTNFALKSAPLRNSRMIQTGTKISGITVNHRMPAVTPADNAIWRNLAGSLLSVGTFGLVHNLLTQDDTAKALTENPVVDILQDIEQRFVRPAPQERQSFNHHHHPQDVQY